MRATLANLATLYAIEQRDVSTVRSRADKECLAEAGVLDGHAGLLSQYQNDYFVGAVRRAIAAMACSPSTNDWCASRLWRAVMLS